MDDLLFAPLSEVHRALVAGTVSPVELLDASLDRVRRWEPALNAFVTVLAEPAREEALRAERALRDGGPVTVLTGIPVTVKDLFDTAGVRTTAGSRILASRVPARDASLVSALRRAGAVLVGKTNLHEFAYGFPHPDYGQAQNPWNSDRTAGGSSSGSAASLAAGIGYASLASDTGGSTRLPAAFSGLNALKPSRGLLARDGMLPLSPTLDHVGLLTRRAEDSALVLRALTGHPVPEPSMTGLRIGVVTDLLGDPLTDDVRDVFEKALFPGAREVRLPGIVDLGAQFVTIMLAEATWEHREWYPSREAEYAAGTRANLAAGAKVTAVEYLAALHARERFRRDVDALLTEVDVLVSPTIGFTAPEREPDFEGGGTGYIQRTIPFNASGHPAMSVPAGLARDGLPVGLQLVAARESTLYRVALAHEKAVGPLLRRKSEKYLT
ncbi:amidase [Amycolatopsis sp. CA-230715]|uniref:amidase n=1 Tax=Amycolatopsis sp. CA-230715 TaxID=2745196 RepID=UPI001C0396D2|nr:amidase [Amycolatopsis sp. CA-230715]QWF81256.1 Putative amidase AmiD [Amycolatopsis sp. CA-230715]